MAKRIRELSDKLSREEISFKIAEEIIYGKFGHLEPEEAAEQSIRTALAILTEGITAAPIQGVFKVVIKENPDRSKHLSIYFAGPIRSAGGTEQALTLVIGDFVRKLIGLDRYKPTEEEVGRFIEELRLYERAVSRFQYHVSDEEMRSALYSIPVEVTGVETDPLEVSSFRNLPRIETNRVRGGALRVVNDGIIGRSAKVWKIVEKLGMEGWDWLKRLREVERKDSSGFMEDVIAGRPIFSFPSRSGGFRLRYGRARNTGLSSVGVHPATMQILHGFLASGTQIRVEEPGKAGVVLPVDSIEPPVVRLISGSVVRVDSNNVDSSKDYIDKILFLGDILVSYGDFLYNNKPLKPSGITEEWWAEELRNAVEGREDLNLSVERQKIKSFIEYPFDVKPTFEEAMDLSKSLGIPLHPKYMFNWSSISIQELRSLRSWLLAAEKRRDESNVEIAGEDDVSDKDILERLFVPHLVTKHRISISGDDAKTLYHLLRIDVSTIELREEWSTLDAISKVCGIPLVDKFPTFLGARMGRPEKAKCREMKPRVHILFPVGLDGGPQRNLVEASKKGVITIELARRVCPQCGEITFRAFCPKCKSETSLQRVCGRCHKVLDKERCPVCNTPTSPFDKFPVDVDRMLREACGRVAYYPRIVKGVKGLTNETRTCEVVEKGLLRAKYDLSVFKDGTTRFDATNAPLTHFKPVEVGVPVEKIRELGYLNDCEGKPLVSGHEICELKVHDVVIPKSCAEYFVKVANFLDDLLDLVYGLPRFYKVRNAEDLVGHLVIGLAPHTSVGVLGRIVGFTDLKVCYAHPYWHSAKRRDCDGDEDALILALDVFINFSKLYLPAQIGGMMDAPLFVIPSINPKELQRQAHNFDTAWRYPLEFYKKTLENASPDSVLKLIDTVENRLGMDTQYHGFGYTAPLSSILMGNKESSYKSFKRMIDKLESQLSLAEKISAVDARFVAQQVLTTHFLKDIAGNLRAFTTQGLRCKSCNKRYRRPPLTGVCRSCGGELTMMVHRGGIEKYIEHTKALIEKYSLPDYYRQRVSMMEDEIRLLFRDEKPRQMSLSDFIKE
ncbi:MAG: DNA polymerase II large subunit [Candidatus Bathyarchaeia archaeon]